MTNYLPLYFVNGVINESGDPNESASFYHGHGMVDEDCTGEDQSTKPLLYTFEDDNKMMLALLKMVRRIRISSRVR